MFEFCNKNQANWWCIEWATDAKSLGSKSMIVLGNQCGTTLLEIAVMLYIPFPIIASCMGRHELHLFAIQGECISVYQSHYTLLILPTGSIPKCVRKKLGWLALDSLLHHGHSICMVPESCCVFCVNMSLLCHSNNTLSSPNVTL